MAIVARIAIIETTTKSSTMVNPLVEDEFTPNVCEVDRNLFIGYLNSMPGNGAKRQAV